MKHQFNDKPRIFKPLKGLELKDMGTINLSPEEQITFEIKPGRSCDIVRKEWGCCLSGNSINAALKERGLKTALIISYASNPPRLYINLVEENKMDIYIQYLKNFNAKVICWLDEWCKTCE